MSCLKARNVDRLGAMMLAALLLSACGSVPKTHYYSVTMPTAAPTADSESAGVLDVARFQAASVLRDDRILYYQTPTELNYYEYHRWSAQPAVMMAELVSRRVRASGVFSDVRLNPRTTPGDFQLRGRLLNFEELDFQAGGHVRVALELDLVRNSDHTIIWSGTERRERAVEGKGVGAVVDALNASAAEVVDGLLPQLLAGVKRRAMANGEK
ncbi:MAG: ABC-type transport auxiliary lipoprotein family protein [Deltaproteobacteria bacterium]